MNKILLICIFLFCCSSGCKELHMFSSSSAYEEANLALDILTTMLSDVSNEIERKTDNFSTSWSQCQSNYAILQCNSTSDWSSSIEILNLTTNSISQNISNLNSDINVLKNYTISLKNQTKQEIGNLCEKMAFSKKDVISIKKIKKNYIQCYLTNRTSAMSFLENGLYTLKSPISFLESPTHMNQTIGYMYNNSTETFIKVKTLLKTLKDKLKLEILDTKKAINSLRNSLKQKIEDIHAEVKTKEKAIDKLKSDLGTYGLEIEALQRKITLCIEGGKKIDLCESEKTKNDAILEKLKEEEALIKNLMDLMGKLQ